MATSTSRARRPRSSRSIRPRSACSDESSSAITCSPGSLVSLAAGLGSFVLLYRLAEERLGAEGARRTVLYLALFPMALFLQAVYSESLYLLLEASPRSSCAERRRFLAAGLIAASRC